MAFSRRVASVVAQREGMMAMPPRSHFIRHFVRNATIATSVIGGGLLEPLHPRHGPFTAGNAATWL